MVKANTIAPKPSIRKPMSKLAKPQLPSYGSAPTMTMTDADLASSRRTKRYCSGAHLSTRHYCKYVVSKRHI